MFMLKKMLETISKNQVIGPDLLHDDFLFVDDFSMETKEEWLATTRKSVDEGIDVSKWKIGETIETNVMICYGFYAIISIYKGYMIFYSDTKAKENSWSCNDSKTRWTKP